MAYPATKTTFTDPSASDPRNSPSHAGLHTSINDTVEAIQDVVGTTAGTSIAKNFAAGDFAARINSSNVFQQTIAGGTLNNTIQGTTRTTGGTISGAIVGTSTFQGGTAAGFALQGQVTSTGTIGGGVIGTATIVGGTLTTPVINGGTYGTINAPASSDLLLVPAAGSVILGSFKRQGGTSNDYSIGGTTNFNETSVFMQFGAGIIGTAAGANSTVITYPVAFSQDPILITTANDETDTSDILYTFVRGVSSTTGTVFSSGAVSGGGLTFNWVAIGKR